MKVVVRYPTSGKPDHYAVERMQWIQRERPGWDVSTWRNGYAVDICRNEIVKDAVDKGADYLIMIDDDIIPTKRVLELPDLDKPIVAGLSLCWNAGAMFWNAFVKDSDQYVYRSVCNADFPTEAPREVYAVGAAILCIRADVLNDEEMRPLFKFKLNEWGLIDSLGGEDIQFCLKARDRGYSIWVDPQTQGEHWRPFGLKQTMARFDAVHNDPNYTMPEVFAMGLANVPETRGIKNTEVKPKPQPVPIQDRLNIINRTLRIK